MRGVNDEGQQGSSCKVTEHKKKNNLSFPSIVRGVKLCSLCSIIDVLKNVKTTNNRKREGEIKKEKKEGPR